MKQKIYVLMDGELFEDEAASLLDHIKRGSDVHKDWEVYHLSGDVLRQPDHIHCSLSAKVRERLQDEPTVLAQHISNQMINLPILVHIRTPFDMVEQTRRFILTQFAVHQYRNFLFHASHLLPLLVSNNGRRFSATASRALKILDRTVPIGQFITLAISS